VPQFNDRVQDSYWRYPGVLNTTQRGFQAQAPNLPTVFVMAASDQSILPVINVSVGFAIRYGGVGEAVAFSTSFTPSTGVTSKAATTLVSESRSVEYATYAKYGDEAEFKMIVQVGAMLPRTARPGRCTG
jgi:hypothetical protein